MSTADRFTQWEAMRGKLPKAKVTGVTWDHSFIHAHWHLHSYPCFNDLFLTLFFVKLIFIKYLLFQKNYFKSFSTCSEDGKLQRWSIFSECDTSTHLQIIARRGETEQMVGPQCVVFSTPPPGFTHAAWVHRDPFLHTDPFPAAHSFFLSSLGTQRSTLQIVVFQIRQWILTRLTSHILSLFISWGTMMKLFISVSYYQTTKKVITNFNILTKLTLHSLSPLYCCFERRMWWRNMAS